MSTIDSNYNDSGHEGGEYEEKRDFIRMEVNSPVTVRQNGVECEASCKDISTTGMLIGTDKAFSVGEQVEIYIDQEGDNCSPFDAVANVSRCKAEEDGSYTIGLSIVEFR